jgi:hypothetical protein
VNAIVKETNSQNVKRRYWKPIEKMTLAMTIFAVAYSLVTLGLYRIANRELESMKKNERPWLRVSLQTTLPWMAKPDSPPTLPQETSPIAFPLHIVNVGKSPAKYVVADFFIESVKNGRQPLLNRTKRLSYFSAGILFPGDPENLSSSYTLPQSEWEDFAEGRSFLVIYGRASYKDVFQVDHWTNFCSFSGRPGWSYSAEKCTNDNNTDDN